MKLGFKSTGRRSAIYSMISPILIKAAISMIGTSIKMSKNSKTAGLPRWAPVTDSHDSPKEKSAPYLGRNAPLGFVALVALWYSPISIWTDPSSSEMYVGPRRLAGRNGAG